MKILHVIDTLGMGGAENILIGLTSGQKEKGHDVTVIPLVCPHRTPVREKMENNGIVVKPLKDKGTVYDPRLIFKICRVLRKYDIIHVHLFPALYWVAFAKWLSFCNVPMVYTEHSTNNKRRNNRILHFVDKTVYSYGYNMVIACAKKVLETFKQAFPQVEHTTYINNGIDTKIYKNAQPYNKKDLIGVDEDTFLVTMVARFMTMKRQDTLVDALSLLSENIHVVFVGGNETDEGAVRVKKLASDKGVLHRVHFLYIRNDVPRILKSSDIVIMASDYEGLSLSSIEGMAAGKPFVASDVNGLREVVYDAGILFENKNSEILSQIINRLSTDKHYYEEVADKCEKRAQEYDVNMMVESYMEVYRKVI